MQMNSKLKIMTAGVSGVVFMLAQSGVQACEQTVDPNATCGDPQGMAKIMQSLVNSSTSATGPDSQITVENTDVGEDFVGRPGKMYRIIWPKK